MHRDYPTGTSPEATASLSFLAANLLLRTGSEFSTMHKWALTWMLTDFLSPYTYPPETDCPRACLLVSSLLSPFLSLLLRPVPTSFFSFFSPPVAAEGQVSLTPQFTSHHHWSSPGSHFIHLYLCISSHSPPSYTANGLAKWVWLF